ncbi:hypothetical protein KR093_006195 [Drosophila rubida]|uniref:Autophagy-related protein 2 n=1 Tax=Drosophila rubida TaxID=30044 RepID=A0AAD4K8B3_9MUSC|nr:hypothetical protein KR093_006195 [Drosophila rubida]
MSWFNLWDGLKTKTCRYLLQRYLGQFFENNLNLEQLKVDLYNGKAVVENISLKVNALNELFEEQGWAFEVISGHVGCLTVMVPWNALMTHDSSLNISDMTITLRPVTRCQSGTTMLESMWSSVSSSMQMAEECMKQIDDDIPYLNHSNNLIGLEKFAETIDNVLNRIHAKLTNTTLNIEYQLPNSLKKLIITFKANHVEYENQTGYEKNSKRCKDSSGNNKTEEEQPPFFTTLPMIAKHHLVTTELTIWTSEIYDREIQPMEYSSVERLCKIVEFRGDQNFEISIKQTENIVGPKVNLEIIIDDIYMMLTPRQIHLLICISKAFNKERPQDKILKQYEDLKPEVPKAMRMAGFVDNDVDWGNSQKNKLHNDFRKTKNCESIFSATSTNSMATSYSNTQINVGNKEQSGEILKFKIQIFKIVAIVLHDEILFESSVNNIATNFIYTLESILNYSKMANDFFPSTRKTHILINCVNPISNTNYIFCMISSLLVNGEQQRFCQELILKTTLSATMVDFSEILDNVEYPLITFDRKKNCLEGYHTRPEFFLSHTSSCFYKQNSNRSSSKIECILDECTADMDITIYDRLSALFGLSPFDKECDTNELFQEGSNPLDINLKCNLFKLQIRFPIVDGRLPLDPMKIPCWEKNIRNDYLSFDFRCISFEFKSLISIIVDEVDGFYCVIHVQDKRSSGLKCNSKLKCKSPFSSKCSYGYSSNIDGLNDSTDKREIFLPGDTDEINNFCENSKYCSHMTVHTFIPKLKVVLESKELYELIYNRLNGDLFMWEPRAYLLTNLGERNTTLNNVENYGSDILKMMNSESVHVNLSNENENSLHNSSVIDKTSLKEEQNMFSFELCVEEGILIMYPEIRELDKKDQRNTKGKLQLNLKELTLFLVTGFNNDQNLSYFCVQLNETDVLHCGQVLEDSFTSWSDNLDPNLKRLIFKSSKDCSSLNNRHEMISIVAELKKQPDNRLKRTKLAFGINGAILLYIPAKAAFNWINQLIDFVNVKDFPIEEYQPYAIVSEIQGHLWNFAIDYRPKYLPYQAFLDISYFSICSNITYPMTGCTLRLMTEDCVLSIGPAVNGFYDFIWDNLLPILNAGVIHISLFLNDQNTLYPKIDLRSSIHDVHLKTCFDSANALAQLIAYIANDRDLISIDKYVDKNKSANSQLSSSVLKIDKTLEHINTLMADAVKDVEVNPISQTSKRQQEEKKIYSNESASAQTSSCSCFTSSDEYNNIEFESNEMLTAYNQEDLEKSLPQIRAELGTAPFKACSNAVEKDFHVIHEDELFFMDKFGVNEVYVSEDPLRIVDNHFSMPHDKVDLLRPPISFPISEESYTLCEMTFTWHLYGGKDFPEFSTKKEIFSAVPKMSETYKLGVSEAPNESHKITPDASIVSQRNSDVLVEIQLTKIRISHDSYPMNATYSSRQVLIISEIEIRDRLKSSDINKLLYHPFSNNISHKNSENMITVKALNARSNTNKHRSEECSLKVSILPIRLNIDQDTLIFLEEYFSALMESPKIVDNSYNNDLHLNRDMPIMTLEGNSRVLNDINGKDSSDPMEKKTLNTKDLEDDSNLNDPIYFKEFIFSPSLPICFDYHGRRIELSRGPITGLVMGLAQLQGSGISLREVICRRGLLGWNKLLEFLCREWLKDIKRNQLPNILSGIGPTNAVLQLFQGFFDLFRLPLQQYNKDGRIIRGFQLGAQSFSARTAIAALEITSRIIHLLQFTAETTFDMLSAGPSLNRRRKSKLGKKRHGRPKDLREGVTNAYTIVKEGINESANTLMEAAVVEHDQKGYSGAVGAVVRQIPQLVVCPAVLATQATTNILGGAKSSLVPEAKREARNKWKYEKI